MILARPHRSRERAICRYLLKENIQEFTLSFTGHLQNISFIKSDTLIICGQNAMKPLLYIIGSYKGNWKNS